MKIIARIYNGFESKFGIPRQGVLCSSIESRIVFEKEYRSKDAIRGIEGFSHLWLIWEFSSFNDYKKTLTVRPPRLGGNKRVGVFATRSPLRPNPIGLTSVRAAHRSTTSNLMSHMQTAIPMQREVLPMMSNSKGLTSRKKRAW